MVQSLPGNVGDARDEGSIPEWGRSPGGGNGYPLHHFDWKFSMDRGAWQASLWDHKESDMTERISRHTFCNYTYSMKNLSPER